MPSTLLQEAEWAGLHFRAVTLRVSNCYFDCALQMSRKYGKLMRHNYSLYRTDSFFLEMNTTRNNFKIVYTFVDSSAERITRPQCLWFERLVPRVEYC